MDRTKRRQGRVALGAITLTLAASLGSGVALAQDQAPVTLRLAVADEPHRLNQPVVDDLVDAVATLSGGAITVEPVFDAAGDAYEEGTARMLVDGEADLALTASRAWEPAGVTSLRALQVPFLIDSDALADAVSTGDVGRDLLGSMSADGVVGLAMWTEELRHPMSLDGCAEPLLTPESFEGVTFRWNGSTVASDLTTTLGAIPTPDGYGLACEVQGGDYGFLNWRSLPPTLRPVITGDVTFFPKVQVLAANKASFERLSESQRDLIHEAAALARDQAIEARPSDPEAAISEWCVGNGSVVLAGPDGIAAFEAAARPIIDRLDADPEIADAIASIRDLKERLGPARVPEACEAAVDASEPVVPPGVVSEIPADGTWRIDVTREALASAGLPAVDVDGVAAVYTWTFRAGVPGSGTLVLAGESPLWGSFECDGVYELREDGALFIDVITVDYCGAADYLWTWESDGGDTARVKVLGMFGMDPTIDRVIWESAPFERID